jgi:starch synthase
MTPFAKVGGLGDVLMGLTRELLWRGCNVETVLPHYGSIDMSFLRPTGLEEMFETSFDGKSCQACVRHYKVFDEIPVALLDTESGFWQKREKIYGGNDEIFSFLFFCRAVVDWLSSTVGFPDLLHVHDWQTALLPLLCRAKGSEAANMKSVLTIHNLEYQGLCSWNDLGRIRVFPHSPVDPGVIQDDARGCLNLVKAGILSVDRVTTVSPTYAREVTTQERGEGLHDVLRSISSRFVGILNGIDYTYWNPEIDPMLFAQYGSQHIKDARAAKLVNKKELFSKCGIPLRPEPLIAAITRLVPQKGISLIHDLFSQAQELGVQCLLLGSAGSLEIEQMFLRLDAKLRKEGRGAVILKSDEAFAHQIYSAADLFVVPSIFEPCGLTQLIALKYGAVPVVRRTGGLADTIIDVRAHDQSESNGFVFDTPSLEVFKETCQRALVAMHDETSWLHLMQRGMQQNFSWASSGQRYLALYDEISL